MLCIASVNLVVPTCSPFFNKSMLKSPHTNSELLYFESLKIVLIVSINISILEPGGFYKYR